MRRIILGAIAALTLGVGAAVAVLPSGSSAVIGGSEDFAGQINGSLDAATVYTRASETGGCVVAERQTDGGALINQSIAVVTDGGTRGLTGASSDAITATFGGQTFTFTDYNAPQALTGLAVPCTGSDTVTFTPNNRTSKRDGFVDTVTVTYAAGAS